MKKEELRQKFHRQVIPKLVWEKPLTNQDRELFKDWKRLFNPDMQFFEHFTNKNILFEIVKYLENNELCIGTNLRHLFASKINNLLTHIYFYKVIEEPKSMYRGLANFKHRPVPPMKPEEKKKWQREFWTGKQEKFKEYVKGYNFGLDIDAESMEEAYKDAKKIHEFFKSFNIKYSVWSSGKKGFHFLIPYEEFEHLFGDFELNQVVQSFKGLMLDLVKLLKLKNVDDKIYSITRYLKLPYSIDKRNGNIIYPLSDKEFENFNQDMLKTEYLLKNKNLGFRGAYPGRKSNPEGITHMIKYLDNKL